MDCPDLLNRFRDFIEINGLIAPSDRVLVAVSGGKDSVAMLDLFSRYLPDKRDRLGAIYIHHGWDPQRHQNEQQFVEELAERYSIAFLTKKIQPKSQRSMSLESWSRQERFKLLSQAMESGRYHLCALGHTRDDQAETVFMRLMRGSGLWGLAGIPVKRGAFIRPLLGFSTIEILDYLRYRQCRFLEDPTNRDRRYLRARIRHEILPKLEADFYPAVQQALFDLSQDISKWREAVTNIFPSPIMEEKGKIMLAQSAFFSYLDIIKKFWLQEALQKATGVLYPLRRSHLYRVSRLVGDGKTGKWVSFPGGVRLYRDRDRLVFTSGERCKALGIEFLAEKRMLQNLDLSQDPYVEWMDGDKLPAPWILRTWQPGDRFQPLGVPGNKKVSDFLVDQKIPRCDKDRVIVLEAAGRIVWVVGYRISQIASITPKTKKVVRCEVCWLESQSE
ncbi:hypothetical protein AMJ86_10035 [bacterium SM23_57]|nr:MAG: hypothetical protein AMJ86_10035 [bacterium SM23_57]